MFTVKFDNKEINKLLNNTVSYSYGFLEGVELNRTEFNRILSGITIEALNKYLDSMARVNPEELAHVYEPGQSGNEKSRLFNFSAKSTATVINISGNFTISKGMPLNGGSPFANRAEIMENGIAITIVPRGNVLAFENNGEMVFDANEIVIEHPGGDAAAGGFGKNVAEFFDTYFSKKILAYVLSNLKNIDEFSRQFASGTKNGRSVGISAGKAYFNATGVKIA